MRELWFKYLVSTREALTAVIGAFGIRRTRKHRSTGAGVTAISDTWYLVLVILVRTV